jgi:peptidoglycan hydrolase-like protein with peptidoglycan-binding domain
MARACIKKGATGEDVFALSGKLQDLGYDVTNPYLSDIDVFDDKLYWAVRKFQKDKGIGVDGTAGPNTWKALGEEGAACPTSRSSGGSSGTALAPTSVPLPIYQRSWFLPVIGGTVGAAILALLFWPKSGGKK